MRRPEKPARRRRSRTIAGRKKIVNSPPRACSAAPFPGESTTRDRIVADGKLYLDPGAQTANNLPSLTSSSVLWVRVTCDASTISARALAQSGEPSDGD